MTTSSASDNAQTSPIGEQQHRLLFELGAALAERVDLDDLISFVVEKCCSALEAEGASVLLHDRETDELYFPYVVARDRETTERLLRLRFPADRGVAGAVLQSGKPVRVDDAASDPRWYGGIDRSSGATTRSLLCVPLRTRQGVLGVLQVLNHQRGEPFPAPALDFLQALSGSVAVAIENAQLYDRLRRSEDILRTQVTALRRDLARRDRFTEIAGSGAAMAEVFRLMESAAAAPITVLIQGETGTGKELVARGIHNESPRASGAFIAVNCAALPDSLLESELFGHRRGSFTGATADRVGLFEAAKGGTIFLDEVGEMPSVMQAKLLRVLQEGEVVPVGDNRPRKVDVRVVSATNRDLRGEVDKGTFREDLYYRLAAFPIQLPPLRARVEDIPVIVDRLIANLSERHKKRIPGVQPDALRALVQYVWPGNVRELQNEIERAIALARDGEAINAAHLSNRVRDATCAIASAETSAVAQPGLATSTPPAPSSPQGAGPLQPLRDARIEFEVRYLSAVLKQESGNVTRAAKALGLSRVALQKKMKEYNLRLT